MKKTNLYKIFIGAFLFLYLIVACISFFHSIQFFSIGNEYWMAVLLGFSFELGQAVVLASILLSENKKSVLTWGLFIVLTLVQCIGNVFSVYKYMSMQNIEYYRFLQEPLLFWIQGMYQQIVKVIISWITGALLPLVALGMTGLVADNLKYMQKSKPEEIESEEILEGDPVEDVVESPVEEVQEQQEHKSENKLIFRPSVDKK